LQGGLDQVCGVVDEVFCCWGGKVGWLAGLFCSWW
jgi:hypothetical protein